MRPATPLLRGLLAALAVLPAITAAQDFPQRKAGLWEMAVQMPGMPAGAMTTQQCVDARTDADTMRKALNPDPRAQCKPVQVKKVGAGYEMAIDCTTPEGRMSGTTKMSGDFQTRYTMESQMKFDPPRGGQSGMQMTFQAQHKGACPAGMAPGEVRAGAFSFNPTQRKP
ncbi:MAG: DUF3617 family protein [Rubrivivax sp.]|nr:DUF3617 family protein [Rubrivivax sp.]